MGGLTAAASTEVRASKEQVWTALTDPAQIAEYMGGSQVDTDWQVGSPIVWRGELNGRPYEDKGTVLVYDRPNRLSVTHYSPLMGRDDAPENYHTLVYTLTRSADATRVDLTQDGCDSQEQAQQFSANWQSFLDGLRQVVDRAG